jgi:hypothetical protein
MTITATVLAVIIVVVIAWKSHVKAWAVVLLVFAGVMLSPWLGAPMHAFYDALQHSVSSAVGSIG